MAKATKAEVESLARWMHHAALTYQHNTRSPAWEDLEGHPRKRYLFVARKMLENPPPGFVLAEKEVSRG